MIKILKILKDNICETDFIYNYIDNYNDVITCCNTY